MDKEKFLVFSVIVLLAFLFGLGFVLFEVRKASPSAVDLGWDKYIGGFLSSFSYALFVTAGTYIVAGFFEGRKGRRLQSSLTQLEADVKKLGHEWLLTNEEFTSQEWRKVYFEQSRHIIIISPDLYNIREEDSVKEVVFDNILKGAKYTYISPRDKAKDFVPELQVLFKDLEIKAGSPAISGSVQVKAMDPDIFKLFGTTHIVIFNPYSDSGKSSVFVETPNLDRGCWIEAGGTEKGAVNIQAYVSEVVRYVKDKAKEEDIYWIYPAKPIPESKEEGISE